MGAEVAFRRRKSVRAEIFVKSTDATSCAGDVEERNVKIAKTKVKYLMTREHSCIVTCHVGGLINIAHFTDHGVWITEPQPK